MAAFVPSEDHIRHCMLFHFHAGLNAAAATRKICDTCGEVLEVNKCQSWYRKFAAGDYDLNDMPRSGRPVQFDEDALKSLVEADPRYRNYREAYNQPGQPYKDTYIKSAKSVDKVFGLHMN
ncbi:unnamed protein product [Hermetia illucens]|uniref:Mos1 transposase HTH domain-containing protein n=1 Tax=Hermetia illucens TaxID=343691 RepID=A0A7R8UF98_HERIL|nr:unnamed protein product [Hermetia illucens]